MSPVEYHPAAREEAIEAYVYYAEIDEDLALDFEEKLRGVIARIRRDPLLNRVRKYGVRRVNLPRFKNQYVAYMLWKESVVVIAIGHGKRRPYYWYRRPKQHRDAH
jgi:toxin ParE1/3/4